MGHLVLAFVLAAAAVGDSVESFEAGPCDTEVAKANTECTAANAAHRKTAKDTCGTADYDARMKKVAKAHTTYQKYVDQEIQMAQMQRKVTVAHKALDEQTTKVEKEIAKAKVTADKEAAALKGIAQSKADLTNEAKVQAVMNARASEKALQAAANSAHLLTGGRKGSKGRSKQGRRRSQR